MKSYVNECIVAPATSISNQAISIIRVSGDDAFLIFNKIVKKEIEVSNKPKLRFLYDGDEIVDEVFVIPFVAPNSFTGENVIEINCHGGKLVVTKIIEMLIKNGCKLAERGEFSKRAYLNGKIDLIKAESINQMINATNETYRKLNARNLVQSHNSKLREIKNEIIDLISIIQTAIDYPEYEETQEVPVENISNRIKKIHDILSNIILFSRSANKLNEGVNVSIIGSPNVGKSSLLNSLINEQKAIVSDIEGTTRDFVEGKLYFENFTLNLVDTAGIRFTEDKIEKIGIEKSYDQVGKSDLVFFVINNDKFDKNLYEFIKKKEHLIIVNKEDELSDSDKKEISKQFENLVFTNAKDKKIDNVIKYLENKFNNEDLMKFDLPLIANSEQMALFVLMLEKCETIAFSFINGVPVDIINIEFYEIKKILDELLGEAFEDEIINNIFKKYCLGK
ncbi:tRNA modification GTPase TrmE [Spiroplasma sp. TIUS-1]|uniref:tRNA uridine-5-carboxymethylaminomethyl(34) synthesis GTPase MnmE n=1 Tax=Spiroplasma sp. TIUS-1 TaxID=216963 RepID=UPI001397485A|nr:tRNA uridine-5-carboxymethylaminomethyl(34) synthesis GTPase MnmE [Spiroplasma sp. TIUS-1]QHX36250.1 tRNA modification GTPase TrmE [Spiroplasma sp. TIUS-1]